VIMNQLAATGVAPETADAIELGKLVEARERIPRAAFDEAIARVGQAGFSADPYLAEESVSDEAALAPIVERIVAANPAQVEQYRNGKDGLLGFFVGQVMKETQGKADPKVVNELLRRVLAA
jgi:aspartyl-tRNA(Asn)/glutamyl-tRNA(Gln) amidotransferase subunit B